MNYLRSMIRGTQRLSILKNSNLVNHPLLMRLRAYSTAEQSLINKIKESFPKATQIEVKDTSGGCGAMFEVFIESPEFQGMNTVRQHLMVNQALKAEISDMHGIRIFTAIPEPVETSNDKPGPIYEHKCKH